MTQLSRYAISSTNMAQAQTLRFFVLLSLFHPDVLLYVKIEAKIGMILSKESRERIWLPIVCETCVMQESDPWFSFQSELPVVCVCASFTCI